MVASAVRTLYFVRHGQYQSHDHVEGGVLTALGRRQARKTGRRFAPLPLSRLIASDLGRAVETAEIIALELGHDVRLRTTPLLREARPTAYPNIRVTLAERADGKQRLDAIVEQYFRPARRDTSDLFICHGNLIRALACRALNVPLTTWRNFGTHHCGVTRFEIRPDGRTVVHCYNDTGHLSDAMVTMR